MSDDTGACPKENVSHGEHGVIKDAEFLARIVLREMVGEDRLLTKKALKMEDFRNKDGWSFVRKDFAEMKVLLAQRANSRRRQLSDYGYALVKTSDIRSMLDDEQKREICVIDDPLPDSSAHALGQKSRPNISKGDVDEIRKKLLELFQEVHYPWEQ